MVGFSVVVIVVFNYNYISINLMKNQEQATSRSYEKPRMRIKHTCGGARRPGGELSVHHSWFLSRRLSSRSRLIWVGAPLAPEARAICVRRSSSSGVSLPVGSMSPSGLSPDRAASRALRHALLIRPFLAISPFLPVVGFVYYTN